MPLTSSLTTVEDVAICRFFKPSTRNSVFLRSITYGSVLSPICASDHDIFLPYIQQAKLRKQSEAPSMLRCNLCFINSSSIRKRAGGLNYTSILMKYITMCLDSTNKLVHWYVRHNNVYRLHLWATCFKLYTGHLQALLYT